MSHGPNMRRPAAAAVRALAGALAGVLALALLAMASWNLAMPELFGLPEMQPRHALGLAGLSLLAAALFRRREGRHG